MFASIKLIVSGSVAIERGVASLVHEVQESGFDAVKYCTEFGAAMSKRVDAGDISAASAGAQCSKVKRIVTAKPAAIVDAWGAGNTSLNSLAAAMPKLTKKGAKKGAASNNKGKAKPAAVAAPVGDNDGPGLTLGKLLANERAIRVTLPKWTANQALLNAFDAFLVLLAAEATAQQK